MATELWKRVALYLRIGRNMIISMHNNANITFIHIPATFQAASYMTEYLCVSHIFPANFYLRLRYIIIDLMQSVCKDSSQKAKG